MKKIYATLKGAEAIYLFIAELNGFKQGLEKDKIKYGKKCYIESKFHNLDTSTEEGRKDFYEDIWLGRLYTELDAFYMLGDTLLFTSKKRANAVTKGIHSTNYLWKTPIELDASASMLQYIGVLLNDRRLMDMTNIIEGDGLKDPWAFKGIPRTQFKHAATPMLYGSSKACYELWQDKGHKYTQEQVKAFNEELSNGAFGLANSFKEFLINSCKPSESMTVKIWNDEFKIACNRFKNVGDKTTAYSIYDSEDKLVNTIHHTHTHKQADLEQFRRYFVTLLIHNLDSQVANRVIDKVMDEYGWGIDIHDAFIVNPECASDVRKWYAEALNEIHANRKEILFNYFTSIGITQESQVQWERVVAKVHPLNEKLKCGRMALK